MPCSYCSLVGASPTAAKWPFIVITEGAVALEAADGRRRELMTPLLGGDVDIARRRKPSIVPAIGGARSVEIITIMNADSNKIEQLVVQLVQVTLTNFGLARYGCVRNTLLSEGTYSELDMIAIIVNRRRE